MRSYLVVVSFLYVSTLAGPAEAYIDPGAGNVLTQLLLGGAAGIAVLVRLYWQSIRSLFRRKKPDGAAAPHSRPR